AAGDFRSRGLGWSHHYRHRDRGAGNLGHPWAGGRAGALVRHAGLAGEAARDRRLRRRGGGEWLAAGAGQRAMKRFAELLDRLSFEPGRNNKLRLMLDYFRTTPDPDRGGALAALTGALSFPDANAK